MLLLIFFLFETASSTLESMFRNGAPVERTVSASPGA